MENTRNCLMEQQLAQVQASTRSKVEYTSFLKDSKKILLDLIDHPFGGKYNIVDHDSDAFAVELFRTPEKKDFLLLLGYKEEAGQFVYNASDENMSKLEDCLQILEDQLNKHGENVLCEINGNNIQRKQDRLISPDDSCERSKSRDMKCSSGLKELFLSKHMKKEQSDDRLLGNRRNISRSSDFAFNTNGYFHQSCSSNRENNKETTRRNNNRCFLRELFHKQDHDVKGRNSLGFNVKLI